MPETDVQTIDQNALADLFPDLGSLGTATRDVKPTFGLKENDADLFKQQTATATPVQGADNQTGAATATQPAAEGAQTAPVPDQTGGTQRTEADVLGTTTQTSTQPSTPLNDLSAYYADRIKNGKFVQINQQDDKGNTIPFTPKTAEEYDEVLDLQLNHMFDKAKKDLEKRWYDSKSPAWKAISKYAEFIEDPTELIPFIQGVRTLQSVANLDENDIEGAERIVRTRFAQTGDPEELVNKQIDALKTTDNLISTAKTLKPLIIRGEQQALAQELKAKEERDKQYYQLIGEIRDNALKSIEAPVFGKTKLKTEEKSAIYDLIAEPAEDTQGYGIYNVIDDLFDKGDFEKLKEVALLLSNRDAFMNYLGINVANQTAASLQRKLTLAGEGRGASGNDYHEETITPSVTRHQFKTKPSFGRQ